MESSKKYHHVFFDLDETLWDFKRNSIETIYELLEHHRMSERGIEGEIFITRYHYHNNIYWDLFRKGKITREELRTIRWKSTLSEFNIHDDDFIKTLSEHYLQLLPNKKNLYTDTIETLDYLQKKYSLHIITNGFEEVQLNKILTSGLASYFIHIITSERAGYQKPNKEIFQYALEIANATVTNSIFIGDSLEADIAGAKNIGIDHILFNPDQLPHAEEVQMEISALSELKKIL
jgi:putative hydrolase of the HAD superfamily